METTHDISYPAQGNEACFQVEDKSFWFHHRNECISALVKRFTCEALFVDVGGGNGFVARRLQDDGHNVTLIEPGQNGANHASVRGIKQVICATLESASGIPGKFEAAGAFDVIEHIQDDAAFVAQIASLLSPGGYFFSTVPAYSWLWSSADDEAGHFRRYTAQSYGALLAPHFDIEFISYFFAALVPPVAILRSLPYRLGVRSSATEESAVREHGSEGGASSRLMSSLLRPEVNRLACLKQIPFGSSLIAVARKCC